MGDSHSFKSKEDLTQRISKSVFVANFPNHFSARYLGNVCTAYGKVVDVYISLKKSKADGNYKPISPPESSPVIVLDDSCILEKDLSCSLMGKIKDINALSNIYVILANKGFNNVNLTYLGGFWVLIDDGSLSSKEKMIKHVGVASWFIELLPASNSFVSEDRLVWISVEGLPIKTWNNNSFAKIVFPWGTLSDVDATDDASLPFKKLCVVTKPHTIINDKIKIIVKGQIYWIRVKELEAWTPEFNNDFSDNSSSDEESVDDKANDFDKDKEIDHVSESSCMNDNGELENHGTSNEQKINSKDPFGIYKLLNRNKDKEESKGDDPTYLPGFTPNVVDDNVGENKADSINQPNGNLHSNKDGISSVKCRSNRSLKLKSGGSILEVMKDLVEVGFKINFLSLNIQGLGQSTKKNWIRELNRKYKVNFAAIQETKLENIDLFAIKALWGNFLYDFAVSPSVGYFGGLLCVWDPNMFSKDSVNISDSFLAIRGTWISSSTKLFIVSVYAPQDLSERKTLWEYIIHMIDLWEGESVILGDFNEVRSEQERFGTIFNDSGANAFNNFISTAGLIDLPLEGYSYTSALKSASKMSKLDRFLIYEGFLSVFPSLSALCLDIGLFSWVIWLWTMGRLHSVFFILGFLNMALKASIKTWCKEDKQRSNAPRYSIQSRISELDKLFDKGKGNEGLAKIRWSIEGDENSKYFHGIINKKRSQLAIRGVLVEGDWIYEPSKVKNEFLSHFSNRFSKPSGPNISLDSQMFKRLSFDQNEDLESSVTYEEIKKAVWDYGTNKSPGPDGFTFDFICKYWKIIDQDVVNVVHEFFVSSKFPPRVIHHLLLLSLRSMMLRCDVQSAFVSNRQILDGPFILNELISWCKYHKTKAMIFKVDFEKAFDSIRWDYLDGILNNFSFGAKWRGWIQGFLNSTMGSILVNGSPTSEFKFHKELKQGDPLSPFLFILVMESLHLSFNNILNAGLFKGIRIDDSLTLSHLFYVDDVINIHKSKLMGIGVPQEEVNMAANLIGCTTFTTPFNYLGVKVGTSSSRSRSWEDVIAKISSRLSKWKIKTLSIGGPMYGDRGSLNNPSSVSRHSLWNNIIRELGTLSLKGINLQSHMKKKVGNGVHTFFWEDSWLTESPLMYVYPRLYALEGIEEEQLLSLVDNVASVILSNSNDRWVWSLDSSGEFSVKSTRSYIDDILLPTVGASTRWVKVVPIKINIFAWKVCLDKLPTRLNLSLRGIDILSISCPICSSAGESCSHLLFSCNMARLLLRKVTRW
ncbi:RNA-directed DNA polymerase, eukaryota [Tanacetum coccineum]